MSININFTNKNHKEMEITKTIENNKTKLESQHIDTDAKVRIIEKVVDVAGNIVDKLIEVTLGKK